MKSAKKYTAGHGAFTTITFLGHSSDCGCSDCKQEGPYWDRLRATNPAKFEAKKAEWLALQVARG